MLVPLLIVLVAALWWVLETGEAVAEKQRLRNTADAAALSAAAWQARVLNFDANMNRAIGAAEPLCHDGSRLRRSRSCGVSTSWMAFGIDTREILDDARNTAAAPRSPSSRRTVSNELRGRMHGAPSNGP